MTGVLIRGASGPDVLRVQQCLAARGFSVQESGVFDSPTFAAVRAFQAQNVDRDGLPLKVDGIVGPLTWAALTGAKPNVAVMPIGANFTQMPPPALGGSATARNALQAAIDELKLGACEEGGNNCGRWVVKYLHGMAPEGSSWCAAFVSWCLLNGNGSQSPLPYSVGARAILAECKARGWTIPPGSGTQPQPGDLVVWWRVRADGWQGHIGFVHHYADGKLYTIEGNKSAYVQGFSYTYATMEKLLGFCRIP